MRRHSLVSLPKAQPPPPPPPPPHTEPPGVPETVLNVAVDWPRDAPTCRRYDPSTVIYDRVPKSGSGSVQVFFEAARARTSHFTACWSRLLTRREMIKPSWLREYVADRLGDALRLVAATVPSFFGGARDDDIPCNKCGNGSPAAPRPPPSAENLQMLHNANALDIALYAYVAERFDAHFDACFPG